MNNSGDVFPINKGITGSDVGGIITARGTGEGLIVRLDGRVDKLSLRSALVDFLNSRRAFLEGNEVTLEWVSVVPDQFFISDLSVLLERDFSIRVKGSRLWENPSKLIRLEEARHGEARASASSVGDSHRSGLAVNAGSGRSFVASLADSDRKLSLFDGLDEISSHSSVSGQAGGNDDDDHTPGTLADRVEALKGSKGKHDRKMGSIGASSGAGVAAMGSGARQAAFSNVVAASPATSASSSFVRPEKSIVSDSSVWDDADARLIHGTLRSGQKVETEHSLIVFGDVNSGAEIIAGGDIVVLGTLRGVAHAGAYDETGGGRIIFALNLRPTQLRIGLVISRGTAEEVEAPSGFPEVARVDGTHILVEPYGQKQPTGRGFGRRR